MWIRGPICILIVSLNWQVHGIEIRTVIESMAAVLEFAADVNRTTIVEKTNRKPFPNDKKSAPTLRVSLLEDIQQGTQLAEAIVMHNRKQVIYWNDS